MLAGYRGTRAAVITRPAGRSSGEFGRRHSALFGMRRAGLTLLIFGARVCAVFTPQLTECHRSFRLR